MRAVVCRTLGEPEELDVIERDSAPCGPGQVRIRVWAAGVNYVDALFVQGRYQIKPPLPDLGQSPGQIRINMTTRIKRPAGQQTNHGPVGGQHRPAAVNQHQAVAAMVKGPLIHTCRRRACPHLRSSRSAPSITPSQP